VANQRATVMLGKEGAPQSEMAIISTKMIEMDKFSEKIQN